MAKLKQCSCHGWQEFVPLNRARGEYRCRYCGANLLIEEKKQAVELLKEVRSGHNLAEKMCKKIDEFLKE